MGVTRLYKSPPYQLASSIIPLAIGHHWLNALEAITLTTERGGGDPPVQVTTIPASFIHHPSGNRTSLTECTWSNNINNWKRWGWPACTSHHHTNWLHPPLKGQIRTPLPECTWSNNTDKNSWKRWGGGGGSPPCRARVTTTPAGFIHHPSGKSGHHCLNALEALILTITAERGGGA